MLAPIKFTEGLKSWHHRTIANRSMPDISHENFCPVCMLIKVYSTCGQSDCLVKKMASPCCKVPISGDKCSALCCILWSNKLRKGRACRTFWEWQIGDEGLSQGEHSLYFLPALKTRKAEFSSPPPATPAPPDAESNLPLRKSIAVRCWVISPVFSLHLWCLQNIFKNTTPPHQQFSCLFWYHFPWILFSSLFMELRWNLKEMHPFVRIMPKMLWETFTVVMGKKKTPQSNSLKYRGWLGVGIGGTGNLWVLSPLVVRAQALPAPHLLPTPKPCSAQCRMMMRYLEEKGSPRRSQQPQTGRFAICPPPAASVSPSADCSSSL